MKPDINLVLQALLVIALLSASPALGAETLKSKFNGGNFTNFLGD